MGRAGAFRNLRAPRDRMGFLGACVIWATDYPNHATYAEFGADQKTVARRRIIPQEMVRLYMDIPGVSTI